MWVSSLKRKTAQAHELDAAVMVVDVSGFSGMCERFAQGLVPDGGWRQRMKVLCFVVANRDFKLKGLGP